MPITHRLVVIILILSFFSGNVSGQEKSLKAVAKEGDGIYSLLRRNGLKPEIYIHAFIELNKTKLGKNNYLTTGLLYKLPEVKKKEKPKTVTIPSPNNPKKEFKKIEPEYLNLPLFGKSYSRITQKNKRLKGAVFYLMAGHGGPDPGALGKYGPYRLAEDEYAYDVTLRLSRKLIEYGATVYTIIQDPNDGIRDKAILRTDKDERTCTGKAIPLNQSKRLKQRTEIVNNLYLKHKGAHQRLVILHIDSRSRGRNIDVYFYHHKNSKSGQQLAQTIHSTFNSKYERYQPERDYKGTVSTRSSLYVVQNTHPPTVFIELGNIRNSRDQLRFVLYNNRQALANWIFEGLAKNYKNSKK